MGYRTYKLDCTATPGTLTTGISGAHSNKTKQTKSQRSLPTIMYVCMTFSILFFRLRVAKSSVASFSMSMKWLVIHLRKEKKRTDYWIFT